MTVIFSPDIDKDSLADDIYALLKNQELNMYAEYAVKGTIIIGAEVIYFLKPSYNNNTELNLLIVRHT